MFGGRVFSTDNMYTCTYKCKLFSSRWIYSYEVDFI